MKVRAAFPGFIMFNVTLVGVLNWSEVIDNDCMGQGEFTQGYHGFAELPQAQEVGCSSKANMVPNAAAPTITTAKGLSLFLFIDLQKIRGAQPE